MSAEEAREKARKIIGLIYRESTERLIDALLAERDAALEEAQKIAADFPADVHGSLPVTPSRIASQVKDEIAAAIRALKGRP